MQTEQDPFWKRKPMDAMTAEEWESLCDHCGICCLMKIERENTGEINFIGVSCEFLDVETADCLVYENRKSIKPDCVVLSPDNIAQLTWLPDTCAYLRVFEKRDLEWWHPLVSGDPETVYQAGISVRDKAVSAKYIHFEDLDEIA